MNKKKITHLEILFALIIVIAIILMNLIGTTTISDDSVNVNEDGFPTTDKTFEDFKAPGTRFGIMTGTDWGMEVAKRYPEAEIFQYATAADIYTALDTGKVDVAMGFIDQRPDLKESHPDLAFIEEPIVTMFFGFGTRNDERGKALCEELNAYFSKIRSNGEYDKLRAKWEDPERTGDVMGDYRFTGEKGTLKISTGGLWNPMTFYVGKNLTGEFVELINGFCMDAGYTPVIEAMSFEAEVTGLASGEYDIVADSITVTEERTDNICVTDALLSGSTYLLVKAERLQKEVSKSSVFFENLGKSIKRNFIDEGRYKMLLSGLGVTIGLSLIAGILGTVLGGFICFLRMSKNSFCAAFASLYIRVFRGIPVLVSLMVLYYVVFGNTSMSAFWVSAIAFSLDFSAYCAEIFRSGIEAVPTGQARAAKALGFKPVHAFRKVVWPQAMVHILPVYSGQFIATVKLTSIAGYIAVVDLTKASDIIRSRTFEAFFPLLFTALVYFLISALLVLILRLIENRITPGRHPINKNILSVVSSFDGAITDIQDLTDKSDSGKKKNDVMLEIEHLKKSFGDVTPIKDVSCKVQKGDVISIIGPSGTGKSTFLNLINRLEFPDGGHIVFEGNDTSEKTYDLNIMREKVGMVFQSFNLFSHLTVIENLMLAQTELLNRSDEEACRKSIELLKMVGMSDKALCFPSQLSGGQQQRIAIVRTVAMEPHMILFDEPTSALDPTMVGEVLSVIRKLARNGMTMLIVTHELNFARDVSNRVFFMDEGTIYEEGTPEQIFNSPAKTKTRQFIKKLSVFETDIIPQNFDYMSMMTQLEQFGYKHMISHKLIHNMQVLIEELCVNILIPDLDKDTKISVQFEYEDSRDGLINMLIKYPGVEKDPFETAVGTSVSLIKHICKDINCCFEDGMQTIRGTIKWEKNN